MENTENTNTENKNAEHWNRTRNLMFVTLGFWVLFSYVVHWFATELNNSIFNGFPFGYYMAAQGSLFAFVIILFVFAWRQNIIDEECGVNELDDDAKSEDA